MGITVEYPSFFKFNVYLFIFNQFIYYWLDPHCCADFPLLGIAWATLVVVGRLLIAVVSLVENRGRRLQ